MSKIMPLDQVMVALDFQRISEVRSFLDQIEESPFRPWMKVGMELFYIAGPQIIEEIKNRGYRIFLDLKLHDIPNTVQGAARSVTSLGVEMFNVHCAGGTRMMTAAMEGVQQASHLSQKQKPLVIGVTQLTSTSQRMMNEELLIDGTVEDCITHYAALAQQSGLNGVVCSALEVPRMKTDIHPDFITVTPGIRLQESQKDDQVRITTPAQAVELGTDYMVIGRAITKASNPIQALEKVVKEISSA